MTRRYRQKPPNKQHGDVNEKEENRRHKAAWLTSGLAQSMVLINGLIITITAFLIFSHYIKEIKITEYKNVADDSGRILVEGVSDLENSMRLITSVISLSDISDRNMLAEKIRRNIPHLSNFDQLIWIYEETPGNWQYKTISEGNKSSVTDADYKLVPNKKIITRLVKDGFFENEDLRIVSDFDGMDYKQSGSDSDTMSRSFAFVKSVKANNSNIGVVVGVSRAVLLFDQGIVFKNDVISRLTIRDVKNGRRLYHMDRITSEGEESGYKQDYGLFVGDSEWQIVLEFQKKQNAFVLQQIPYIILLFGISLTTVGTLFIRSNYKQSKKLENVNAVLEQRNYELSAEVSERERLNEILAISERDNRAIIDAVSDVIFETDVDGKVLFLSAAWQKVTGFETERSKGSNLFTMLYPEDQEKQKYDFEMLVKGQRSAYRSFTRIRISDGTFRAIELAVSMIRQDDNKKTRVVGTITDVEERRRAERALAEAEKKYRTIVENAAGGLYQLTPEGIYLSANPAMARVLGYSTPEEMLRLIKNANGAVYPDPQERDAFARAVMTQDQLFGYETQVATKDGSKIWVRENVRVVRDEQNNILYFEGSMEDITKRKEADIALMEAKIQSDMASRAKTEFIANMSHELRTPLNSIIGFSDIMKNEVMGPLGQDMYREYAADINRSGKGLLKIINEILDISKIESGDRDLNESEFNVGKVLQTCIDLYAARVKEKRIIIMNEASDMPVLLGEELSIKQVIGNIYSNAVKYTPTEGRITLFTSYDIDGTFRFSITDTGVGMTPREIEKALSAFGQVDNALDRSGSGTGLGLPLARAMMGIHGGRIEILSEKSIGTTVTIVFPAERVIRREQKEVKWDA